MKVDSYILTRFEKLIKKKDDLKRDTWCYNFEINNYKTKFHIVNEFGNYYLYLKQDTDTILLGMILNDEDLKNLFFNLTRGETLR